MSAIAPPSRRSPARSSRRASSALYAGLDGSIALLAAAAGLTIAQAHPLWPYPLMVAFVAWGVFAAMRPGPGLAGLFALLPLAGFAPQTGWLTFEELDLLVLATMAGGYAARAQSWMTTREATKDSRFDARLSIVAMGMLACYVALALVSMGRGIDAAGGFAFGWTQNFNGPLNSVRIFKGLAWSLLVAPLVLDELRGPAGLDRIGRGMTIALGLAGLAVLQERHAFVGLLDFTQDYRATGSFWEMHVGGATLDAFLLLSVPFAVREALRARSNAWLAIVCAILGLAAYSALSTFSRGLYLALVVEGALLVVAVLRRLLRLEGLALAVALVKWVLFGIGVAIADFFVFRHGGYRGTLAALAVLALALRVAPIATQVSVKTLLLALVVALVLGVGGYALATVLPKGPYVVFALVFAGGVAAVVNAERHASRLDAAMAIVAWVWLAVAACVVSDLWGGHAAGRDSVIVMGSLVVLVALTVRVLPTIWSRDVRKQFITVGLALLIVAPVTVLSAGAYMGDRLQASHDDWRVRAEHWSEAIGRFRTSEDWLLGLGLGRYPASSLFSGGKTVPGTYAGVENAEGSHLTLTGPGLKYLGFGEMFRVTQIVDVRPRQRYVVTIRARAAQATPLHTEICEKHLIYSLECASGDVTIPAGLDAWTELTTTLDSATLGDSPWYAKKAIVFAMAVGEPRSAVQIQSVQLRGNDGVDLIANGSFRFGTARWFSSSDLNHGPFHLFNLAVGVLFDQGILGLAMLTLLVAGALIRTVLGRAHRHPDAAFVATALVAFLVLGIIDDPIDAPRIAFLFHSVLLLGLMLRNPRAQTPVRPQAGPRPPAPPPSRPKPQPTLQTQEEQAAAERALRRQQAFGTRKRIDA